MPKITVAIHQHLLDQHILGKAFVNDRDGTMMTLPISLSADFFHPSRNTQYDESNVDLTVSETVKPATEEGSIASLLPAETPADDPLAILVEEMNAIEAEEAALVMVENNEAIAPEEEDLVAENQQGPLFEPTDPLPLSKLNAVLGNVQLEVYSSTTSSLQHDNKEEIRRHLRSRFATYQRRLEALLLKNDHAGFDECILDFWDEFLPHTAGIHYHDRHTAVPRISNLSKFLTKPCPKAIGVIQCEIERIKTTSKGRAST
jgi:hypothetical protein